MLRGTVTVALLLITGLINDAAAGDSGPKDSSKKAQKVSEYLQSIGVNNPKLLGFISTANERIEGRYLRIADEDFESGRLVLHYRMRPKISTRQLELKYQFKDDNKDTDSEIVATTHSVMFNYTYRF